eukprot:TRINITY_DN67771_c13_g6_i1.p1 TRINITY_DN67771_c13_g6~~TRINITY_DN67771_c13_g6_i1.p1  ORF type:complete len:285 (-),score=8.62 TRINITY_DN67771_c13_g6_i1:401-1255(-)
MATAEGISQIQGGVDFQRWYQQRLQNIAPIPSNPKPPSNTGVPRSNTAGGGNADTTLAAILNRVPLHQPHSGSSTSAPPSAHRAPNSGRNTHHVQPLPAVPNSGRHNSSTMSHLTNGRPKYPASHMQELEKLLQPGHIPANNNNNNRANAIVQSVVHRHNLPPPQPVSGGSSAHPVVPPIPLQRSRTKTDSTEQDMQKALQEGRARRQYRQLETERIPRPEAAQAKAHSLWNRRHSIGVAGIRPLDEIKRQKDCERREEVVMLQRAGMIITSPKSQNNGAVVNL